MRGKGQKLNSASRSRSLGPAPLRHPCSLPSFDFGGSSTNLTARSLRSSGCAALVHSLVNYWKHLFTSNSTSTAPRPYFLAASRGTTAWGTDHRHVLVNVLADGNMASAAARLPRTGVGTRRLSPLLRYWTTTGGHCRATPHPCCSSPDNPSLLTVNILPRNIPTLQDRCLRPRSADAHLRQFIDWRPPPRETGYIGLVVNLAMRTIPCQFETSRIDRPCLAVN